MENNKLSQLSSSKYDFGLTNIWLNKLKQPTNAKTQMQKTLPYNPVTYGCVHYKKNQISPAP